MRQYRAWTGSEMLYNVYPYIDNYCILASGYETEIDTESEYYNFSGSAIKVEEVMEETEAYDKNWESIFVWDIVYDIETEKNYLVFQEWSQYVLSCNEWENRIYLVDDETLEVIGTIYENPELLNNQ